MTRITCSQTCAIIFSCKDISIMKVIMMPIKSLCKNNFLVHTNPVLSHKLFCKTYLKAFSLERDDICIQNGPPVFCKCSTCFMKELLFISCYNTKTYHTFTSHENIKRFLLKKCLLKYVKIYIKVCYES